MMRLRDKASLDQIFDEATAMLNSFFQSNTLKNMFGDQLNILENDHVSFIDETKSAFFKCILERF